MLLYLKSQEPPHSLPNTLAQDCQHSKTKRSPQEETHHPNGVSDDGKGTEVYHHPILEDTCLRGFWPKTQAFYTIEIILLRSRVQFDKPGIKPILEAARKTCFWNPWDNWKHACLEK